MIGRWRTPKDAQLAAGFETERFDLVPCSLGDAFKLSWRWTQDPEILLNITFDTTPRSKVAWFRTFPRPDNRSDFAHGIVPKGGAGAIGMHSISVDRNGTAHMSIVVHGRSWWDKGVFAEVRRAALAHVFASDRVVKCLGFVHARNAASIFNYRQLGFRMIGPLRQHRRDPHTGERHDVVYFELLREEWQANGSGA